MATVDSASQAAGQAEFRTRRVPMVTWVVIAFAVVAVAGVFMRPLLPVDETRYLAVAWEMHIHGDYLVPHRNGAVYPDKPPLLFWLINLVWMLTGVSEIAARLIGPALAVGALGLTGRLAGRLWPDDKRTSRLAPAVLAGMAVFGLYGGLTMFDALLTVVVLLGLIALVAAFQDGRWRHWAAFGGALGVGILAKGPVVLIHLAPALLLWPLWARQLPCARRVGAGAALALLVGGAVVSLWLVPAMLRGDPSYREAILWTQTAGRMVHAFDHARPWWFYAALLPILLFPWILSPGVWRACRSLDGREPGVRLSVVAGGSGFLLLSALSGKQLHYLLPELAMAALSIARAMASSNRPMSALLPASILVAAAGAALAVNFGLVSAGDLQDELAPHAAVVRWACSMVALAAVAVWAGGFAGLAITGIGLVLAANLLVATTGLGGKFDGARLAAIAARHDGAGIALFASRYNSEFSFLARLTHEVAEIPDTPALAIWMADHPQGVVMIKEGRGSLPWPALQTVDFNGRDWSIWSVADAPVGKEVSPRFPYGGSGLTQELDR